MQSRKGFQNNGFDNTLNAFDTKDKLFGIGARDTTRWPPVVTWHKRKPIKATKEKATGKKEASIGTA
jgi:hypothetical protein